MVRILSSKKGGSKLQIMLINGKQQSVWRPVSGTIPNNNMHVFYKKLGSAPGTKSFLISFIFS